MPDPVIYTDWRAAKGAAGALANAVGATLLQNEHGKPRTILGQRIKDHRTWLAAWSYLYRIRCDQIATEAAQKTRQPTGSLQTTR